MISPVIGLVKNWCQTGQKPLCTQEDLKMSVIAQFQLLSPTEKWSLIQKIDREFSQKNSDPSKVALFKKILCGPLPGGWKNSLLECQYQIHMDLYHQFICYSNNIDQPLDTESRLSFISDQNIFSCIGSSFATNKLERIDHKGHHILDSIFACSPSGGGFSLALADGAGGHFGDLYQDERIARAAHCGTKTSARLFSAYHEPEDLYRQLPLIVGMIAKEIERQAGGEGATLLACRAFPTEEGFRVVGFNIGDGMLLAWHPATKKGYQLFPAHASEAGTAFLPGAYRTFEVQKIDVFLPEETLLFLISDGIHDHLPFGEEDMQYPNNLSYRVRTLSSLEGILGDISPQAPVEIYLKTIVQTCMSMAERERSQHYQPNIQMGDDLSILQCHLVKK